MNFKHKQPFSLIDKDYYNGIINYYIKLVKDILTSMNLIKNKKILILAIIWMMVIFYLSHQPAEISSNQSSGVIEILSNMPIIGGFISNLIEMEISQFIIRKSAHMIAYLLLAVLFFLSMYSKKTNILKISITAFIFTVIYACTDEIHQLFIPGRSGELRDVGIDSIGAFIGSGICYISWYFSTKLKIK
ncbi:MAG: VanZ family protein [Paraclostridium sp.]